MPQIIVTADRGGDRGEMPVMLRERVTRGDFESSHFGQQLLERLGWAVGDAHELEQNGEREPEQTDDDEELASAEPAFSAARPGS